MNRGILFLFLLISIPSLSRCEENRIDYWAGVILEIKNYEYKSGYIEKLGLEKGTEILKQIEEHLLVSFKRFIQGDKPFTNIYPQYKRQFDEYIKNTTKERDIYSEDNFMERYYDIEQEASALVAANVRANFGTNPGVFGCVINIKRNEFPILYEIKLIYSKDKDLGLVMGIHS